GEIKLSQIGIGKQSFFGEAPSCFTLEEPVEALLPKRTPDGNKGTFGKALLIAGSKNMSGAALLSARACYRMGAGMVKLLSDKENRVIIQESIPEALLGELGNEIDLSKSIFWSDVICIGPGLGRSKEAKDALNALLSLNESYEKAYVIDADGLNLIASEEGLAAKLKDQAQSGRTIVLTPHPMELKRLYDALFDDQKDLPMEEFKKNLCGAANKIAQALSVIVVAKDARTFVCAKDKASYLNLSGNSGMGTAGSGDVLAGIITAFLAQEKEDPFLTTCKAVRTHGLLGDLASKKLGEHGVMAGDLINAFE
ncbi:MAG: NAD(P)H-hydrate dehydratase, partial [Lachnospiraceae bacterium]|nr:NAD(P)H-hydrate dehydratase [Lachnospiraceae bacterium]